jgi:hypothetical protein
LNVSLRPVHVHGRFLSSTESFAARGRDYVGSTSRPGRVACEDIASHHRRTFFFNIFSVFFLDLSLVRVFGDVIRPSRSSSPLRNTSHILPNRANAALIFCNLCVQRHDDDDDYDDHNIDNEKGNDICDVRRRASSRPPTAQGLIRTIRARLQEKTHATRQTRNSTPHTSPSCRPPTSPGLACPALAPMSSGCPYSPAASSPP